MRANGPSADSSRLPPAPASRRQLESRSSLVRVTPDTRVGQIAGASYLRARAPQITVGAPFVLPTTKARQPRRPTHPGRSFVLIKAARRCYADTRRFSLAGAAFIKSNAAPSRARCGPGPLRPAGRLLQPSVSCWPLFGRPRAMHEPAPAAAAAVAAAAAAVAAAFLWGLASDDAN